MTLKKAHSLSLVSGRDFQHPLFNVTQFLAGIQVPGEIRVHGVTGQTGSGKTRFGATLRRTAEECAIPHQNIELDWFHRRTRAEKRVWISEPGIDEEERAFRRDQLNWFDYDRLAEVLAQLRSGHRVALRGMYNYADDGEFTLNVDLSPKSGKIFSVEGVAINHVQGLEEILFLFAPPSVRRSRLGERDQGHRTTAECDARFALTQAFERRYLDLHWGGMSFLVDNTDPLNRRILPKDTPKEVLLATLDETTRFVTTSTPNPVVHTAESTASL